MLYQLVCVTAVTVWFLRLQKRRKRKLLAGMININNYLLKMITNGNIERCQAPQCWIIWTSAAVTKKENYSLGRMQKACTISLPCCLKPPGTDPTRTQIHFSKWPHDCEEIIYLLHWGLTQYFETDFFSCHSFLSEKDVSSHLFLSSCICSGKLCSYCNSLSLILIQYKFS